MSGKETFDAWWEWDQSGGNFDQNAKNSAYSAWHEAQKRHDMSTAVKEIVWGETSHGTPEANTVVGSYRITKAWDNGFNVNRGDITFQDADGRKNFATVEAAKAAAQSDFNARILSAITIASTPNIN